MMLKRTFFYYLLGFYFLIIVLCTVIGTSSGCGAARAAGKNPGGIALAIRGLVAWFTGQKPPPAQTQQQPLKTQQTPVPFPVPLDAQFKRGMLYFEGKDVPQDFTEAVKWFRMAGDRGHIEAQYLLGSCYYLGNGVPQNNAKAIEWWRKAAKQKHKDAIGILQGLGEEID
jgi:hypothetical protein